MHTSLVRREIMKISFIIPLYNCQDYIIKCLESIISIKYDNYEILVINDGSSDKSRNIVENFIKENKQVKLYNKHNEGLSLTRNFGIDKAEGDYIFFVDADDMLISDRVDKIINLCLENKYDIIAGTYVYLENNNFRSAPFELSKDIDNDLNYLLTLHNYTAEAVKYLSLIHISLLYHSYSHESFRSVRHWRHCYHYLTT